MTVIQAVILGLVQGLTEFMPISSSAHLIVVPWLFRWDDPGLVYNIALHLGTLAALLWYFRSEWTRLVRAGVASIKEKSAPIATGDWPGSWSLPLSPQLSLVG